METYVKTGKIRLVYKHLIGYGDESRLAAEAAECAAEQNLFWPYYEALMQSSFSSTKEDITVEKLYEIAEFVGLYVAQFDQSLASGKYKAKVSQDDVEGRSFGYNTIPMLFINGEKLEDKYIAGLEEFQKYMDEKLAEAGK
jgi:protein-disulfide isomerase